MKTSAPFAVLAALVSVNAAADCNINTGRAPLIPFQESNVRVDGEYKTYRSARYDGITFYLRAGHGVARLEAWEGKRMLGETFYSYGRDPQQADHLVLGTTTRHGEAIEAACDGVDAIIGG